MLGRRKEFIMNTKCMLCIGALSLAALTGCENTLNSTGDAAVGIVHGTGSAVQGVGEGTGNVIKGIGTDAGNIGTDVNDGIHGNSKED
jgi:hypothetical protein